ncbi:aldolase/citrate lyase family protein [Paenarthrobacter sp. AT5]|uniref:HpcH/HpaI aldolase family protein n=1 Tax=Paenarthrobacter TaxID=1742992 RepID=UPI001A98B4FE|nr:MULTISPECIES: aldolase/citrate lyase family protein [Paenarthrobacter]QSZ54016.1 2,4-dihydroxyhept-2-ene-1,7-dioic acid aldolase [Paenarthrobacter ureafaciens]WOC62803.1 aldolase/citrate lyase family protein [Paenarthrobacter sp. AT5]
MSTRPLDGGALRRRLTAGEVTVGTFIGMASATAAEVCAASGADWVLIDLEHGSCGEDAVRDGVIAAGAYGVPTLVRVESGERIRIGRVLDQGAAGIMVPRLNTVTEAAQAVKHMLYPPYGDRGVATYNRSCRWGMDREPLGAQEQSTVGIIQIETLDALESVEDIAAQDGVDVLFVGPLDLSYALGVPLQLDSNAFQEALQKVVAAAERHNKAAGILAVDGVVAAKYVQQGFRFVAIGSDSTIMAAAFRDAFDTARN